MKLFFGEITGNLVSIHDEEQHHITKVLRMTSGEAIFVTDGKGNLAQGTLLFEGKRATLNEVEVLPHFPHYTQQLHIAIAPTKNMDRIEFFVEKATEMGIAEITFLHTEKTERKNIGIDKLRKRALAASKQSLRYHFPILNDLTPLSVFLKNRAPENTFVAHCHQNLERISLQQIHSPEKTILVGPEGDFTPQELQQLVSQNIPAISLGSQRLRTETAGIYLAAWNYNKM